MFGTVITPPIRVRMSLATGAKALAVGVAAEGTAQQTQSLTLTIVAGAFVLGAAVAVPLINYLLSRLRAPDVNHHQELINEQADFIEHLRAELVDTRAEITDLEEQIRQLRRHRA